MRFSRHIAISAAIWCVLGLLVVLAEEAPALYNWVIRAILAGAAFVLVQRVINRTMSRLKANIHS
jgi:hypothetical protein